jgi:hypothetical protein
VRKKIIEKVDALVAEEPHGSEMEATCGLLAECRGIFGSEHGVFDTLDARILALARAIK